MFRVPLLSLKVRAGHDILERGKEQSRIESEPEEPLSESEDEDMLRFRSPREEVGRTRRQDLPGSSSPPQTVPPPSANDELPLYSFQSQDGSSSPLERRTVNVAARIMRGGETRERSQIESSLRRTTSEIARGWVERTIGTGSSRKIVVVEGDGRFDLGEEEAELVAHDDVNEPDDFRKLVRTHCVWRSSVLPPTAQEDCLACEEELGVCWRRMLERSLSCALRASGRRIPAYKERPWSTNKNLAVRQHSCGWGRRRERRSTAFIQHSFEACPRGPEGYNCGFVVRVSAEVPGDVVEPSWSVSVNVDVIFQFPRAMHAWLGLNVRICGVLVVSGCRASRSQGYTFVFTKTHGHGDGLLDDVTLESLDWKSDFLYGPRADVEVWGYALQLLTLENRGGLPTPLAQIPQLASHLGVDERLRQVLSNTRNVSSARATEIATEAQRMLTRIEAATSRRVYRGMEARVERLEVDLEELIRERDDERASQPERSRAQNRRRSQRRRAPPRRRSPSSSSSETSSSATDADTTETETETEPETRRRKRVRFTRKESCPRRDP